MRISDTSKTQGVSKAGKKKKTASGTGFSELLSQETEDAASAAPVASTVGVGALLSLQEVDDATAHASKAKLRAEDMLDQLDELRVSLLTGELPAHRLQKLVETVAQQRGEVDDPRLNAVLDEIDLRAQVELAKRGVAGV